MVDGTRTIVVKCSNCGQALIGADNGSKTTSAAELPCLDERCGAKKSGSETVVVDMPENSDAVFPTNYEEESYLCHVREILCNDVGDKAEPNAAGVWE